MGCLSGEVAHAENNLITRKSPNLRLNPPPFLSS